MILIYRPLYRPPLLVGTPFIDRMSLRRLTLFITQQAGHKIPHVKRP